MINNLHSLVENKDLLAFTFGMIFDYIEIWDDFLQISLAVSISDIFCKEVNGIKNMKEVTNPLLRFCMKMISTELENVK
jgi:hypothetical protein